jgi:hypothetical protein
MFRYVDDSLIVYDRNTSNIHDITEDFNNITPELKFTLERETNRQINYLNITIQRTQRGFSTNIYRKTTTTDSIIPNDSCHPIGHKMAAIHYLYNRMNTYQLSKSAVKLEENTIIQIFSNNKYDPSILDKVKHKKENQNQNRTIKTTNGPNSHTPAVKPCSSPRFSKKPTSKLPSPRITQSENSYQKNWNKSQVYSTSQESTN